MSHRTKLVVAEAHKLHLQLALLAAQPPHHNALACRDLPMHTVSASVPTADNHSPAHVLPTRELKRSKSRQVLVPDALYLPLTLLKLMPLVFSDGNLQSGCFEKGSCIKFGQHSPEQASSRSSTGTTGGAQGRPAGRECTPDWTGA